MDISHFQNGLIFPIGFDIEGGVQKAIPDVEKWLREMERLTKSHPLRVDVEISPERGSVENFRKRLSQKMQEFNKLSQENRVVDSVSGEYNKDAKELLAEIEKLTIALATNARSAEDWASVYKRSIDEQLNFAKAMSLTEDTLKNVDTKLKAYKKEMERIPVGSEDWNTAAAEVERLSQLYAQMRVQIRNNTGESAKDAEKRILSEQRVRDVLADQENTIAKLQAKIKEYNKITQNNNLNSTIFKQAVQEIERLEIKLNNTLKVLEDFKSKAFSGLSYDEKKTKGLYTNSLRGQITDIDKEYNRMREAALRNGTPIDDARVVQLMNERIRLTRELANEYRTMGDIANDEEAKINKKLQEQEQRRRRIQELWNTRRKSLEQERRILNEQATSMKQMQAQMAALQKRFSAASVGSQEWQDLAAKIKDLSLRIQVAQEKAAQLGVTGANAANRNSQALGVVNSQLRKQTTYVERLIKRMLVYGIWNQFTSFISKVREVTAEFELQRVSLAAIVQNQQKADLLFGQIKNLALNSPVKLLDLTKYTKQLAAYKIGYDDLFDTMKRLTDVSVGLGVSMDRVILAYGQVRATGHLRASEIRQFTEMGVPIVEELAAKLTKMNGELVTSADVMKMVSERAISFEMVKQVFDDMTSAGGIFYDMQAKQGDTLYGMWQKLGDAADIMYSKIGEGGVVNWLMKKGIDAARSAMLNYNATLITLGFTLTGYLTKRLISSSAQLATSKERTDALALATQKYEKAQAAAALATEERAAAEKRLAAARAMGDDAYANYLEAEVNKMKDWENTTNKALKDAKKGLDDATKATSKWSVAMKKLGSVVKNLGFMALLTVVSTLIFKIVAAIENAGKLRRELESIKANNIIETQDAVDNFENLANAAVKAADGSQEQRKALEELQRTYRDIIPEQDLTIEKLREMHGEYGKLTQAIKEYYTELNLQKGLEAINEEYREDITEETKKLIENLSKLPNISEESARKIVAAFVQGIKEGMSFYDAMNTAFTTIIGKNFTEYHQQFKAEYDTLNGGALDVGRYFAGLSGLLYKQKRDIDNFTASMRESDITLREYTQGWENFKKAVEKVRVTQNHGGSALTEGTWLYNRTKTNFAVQKLSEYVKSIFQNEGQEWDTAFEEIAKYVGAKGEKMSVIFWDSITNSQAFDAMQPQAQKAIERARDYYFQLLPPNELVEYFKRFMVGVTQETGASMDKMQHYLYNGTDSLKDYAKQLEEKIASLRQQIHETTTYLETDTLTLTSLGYAIRNGIMGLFGMGVDDMKAQLQTLEEYLAEVKRHILSTTKDGGRVGNAEQTRQLVEIENSLTTMYQKYQELIKAEGEAKAQADITHLYKRQIAYINDIAKKWGLAFQIPTQFKTLQDYRKAILRVINELKEKGFERYAIDLEVKMGTADLDKITTTIKDALTKVADEIAQSKLAQEFYTKVLGLTGDRTIAEQISDAIFGETGSTLKQLMKYQIQAIGGLDNTEYQDAVGRAFKGMEVDYAELRDIAQQLYAAGKLGEEQFKSLINLVQEGTKAQASQYEAWLKELEVAKDYADQRVELERTAQTRLEEIRASAFLSEEQKFELREQYMQRYRRELAKLEYEEFKNSDLYAHMFDNLENASTQALRRMREEIVKLKDQWQNLTPTELKELQKRLNELDKQLANRNPIKSLTDALRQLRQLRGAGRTRGGDEADAIDAQRQLREAKDLLATKEAIYDEAVRQHGADSAQAQEARLGVEMAKTQLRLSQENANQAEENARAWEDIADAIDNANKAIDEYQNLINEALQGVRDMMEALGAGDEALEIFDELSNAVNNVVDGLQSASTALTQFATGDIFHGLLSSVNAVTMIGTAVANLFNGSRVRKANREIEKQQKIIDQLTYSYGKLEQAQDKVFGVERITNYNNKLKALQKQSAAYTKQLQAEQSKGKKADKDKVEEYRNSIRDITDQIKEMEQELSEYFMGTSRNDVARQMAESWLEARLSMSDTFSAISEDYKSMIKTMIVEGFAARIIENALAPMWDNIDAMIKASNLEGALDLLINSMDSVLATADNGMEMLFNRLQAAGYNLKNILGDSEYSGIAKDVASATSEEINAQTAALTTQNYYVSHIPTIAEHVAMIRQIMEGGGNESLPSLSGGKGWSDWQQQAMENYMAIARNTSDTAVRCERAAAACERISTEFHRVVTSKGGKNVIQTTIV